MPTKTEQADLTQALFGRPAESPLIILAPCSPSDCFHMAIEAFRLAVRCMSPVILLSDGYLANGAEPWLIPDLDAIEPITVRHPDVTNNTDGPFLPYLRDGESLARPWAIPGTAGLEHRLGGLEKQADTGHVSYDPDNHELMTNLRADKVAGAADVIPPLAVAGPDSADVLLLGWGSTYGAIATAAKRLNDKGHAVAVAHMRYLNPFPANTGDVLARFKTVIIPEINRGQLQMLIRSRYLVDAIGINRVRGRAFLVDDLVNQVLKIIKGG
jgi:2-oxoglutarate ferredoxin oxidoreductase subunit alpha